MEYALSSSDIKKECNKDSDYSSEFTIHSSDKWINLRTEVVEDWNDLSWSCSYCNHSSNDYLTLKSHQESSHQINNSEDIYFRCEDCKESLLGYVSFLNHIRNSHYGTLKMCCDVCNQMFSDYEKISVHRDQHIEIYNVYPRVYHCTLCEYVEPTEKELKNHIQLSHNLICLTESSNNKDSVRKVENDNETLFYQLSSENAKSNSSSDIECKEELVRSEMQYCVSNAAIFSASRSKKQHCASLLYGSVRKSSSCAVDVQKKANSATLVQPMQRAMTTQNEDLSVKKLKLLVRTRLDLESEFVAGRKKKSFLWGKVLEGMLKVCPELEMTREQISRKFLNLVTTYKRIKERINSTGRNATSWEFFDDFEDVYGTKHSISPPTENLQSSLNSPLGSDSTVSEPPILEEGNEEPTCSTRAKRRKFTSSENMLKFLKAESKREQRRHEEVMNLEREKLKVEKERVQSLTEIKTLLKEFLNK